MKFVVLFVLCGFCDVIALCCDRIAFSYCGYNENYCLGLNGTQDIPPAVILSISFFLSTHRNKRKLRKLLLSKAPV